MLIQKGLTIEKNVPVATFLQNYIIASCSLCNTFKLRYPVSDVNIFFTVLSKIDQCECGSVLLCWLLNILQQLTSE